MNLDRLWQHGLLAFCLLLGTILLAQEDKTQTEPQPPPPPAVAPPAAPAAPAAAKPPVDFKEALARQVIESLRTENPARFEELMQLRRNDQAAFMAELQKLGKEWWQRKCKGRPPMSREELACRELSWRYHDTQDEAEREKLREQLVQAVNVAFEARVKALETRAENMERELDKFRERLKELKENRDTVCADRVDELLRPPELNWNATW